MGRLKVKVKDLIVRFFYWLEVQRWEKLWWVCYKPPFGRWRCVAGTGCRTKSAAERLMAHWNKEGGRLIDCE